MDYLILKVSVFKYANLLEVIYTRTVQKPKEFQ